MQWKTYRFLHIIYLIEDIKVSYKLLEFWYVFPRMECICRYLLLPTENPDGEFDNDNIIPNWDIDGILHIFGTF